MSTVIKPKEEMLADIRKAIADLNDKARKSMGLGCRLVVTPGIRNLPAQDQSAIREKVEKFNDFNPDNDPFGEHDYGSFDHNGVKVLWKIDYYDRSRIYHSPDPADPALTVRVLTIMLAEEW